VKSNPDASFVMMRCEPSQAPKGNGIKIRSHEKAQKPQKEMKQSRSSPNFVICAF
jgi:hypothetical protein